MPSDPWHTDEARLRLAAIVESSDDAIIGKDLDGVVTSWNNAAERTFGYSAAEIIGWPIFWIIPPDRMAEEVDILARLRRGERIIHFETERLHRSGRRIAVLLSISPIRDDQRRIIGVAKIARDLSEIQRVDGELRHREALLQSILATVPDALIVFDALGQIHSFSAAAERLFGYAAAETIGCNVKMLMPVHHAQVLDDHLRRYQKVGQRRIVGIDRGVNGLRKDRSTFPMELSIGEVELAGAHLFTGFVRDLTERHERERRLDELQAELIHVSRLSELGQMASMLAHEVNQPLTAIAMYAHGVRRLLENGDQEAAQRTVKLVAEQAERARTIINGLRNLVRKDTGGRRVEEVAKIVEETSALALIGVRQDLRLEIDIDSTATHIFVNRIQIQQILLNLIRNALEAMSNSDSRVLSISSNLVGEMVELSVRDTGPGLSELVREHLFKPFVTTKPSGLGVGLSICRAIADAHGGALRADSTAGGTTFYLSLPRLTTLDGSCDAAAPSN